MSGEFRIAEKNNGILEHVKYKGRFLPAMNLTAIRRDLQPSAINGDISVVSKFEEKG
jgi:hypothetical protein